MNAKQLADAFRRDADSAEKIRGSIAPSYLFAMATHVEKLHPRFRPPRPIDDGRYCFLEELPSDAPPTLVRSYLPLKWSEQLDAFEVNQKAERVWQYWTVAGWRELTKGVWPCERPEGGGT